MEFKSFQKIPRYNREIIITEKLDGTNGQILITNPALCNPGEDFLVGSRNRWITPDNDNYGFARWAHDYRFELIDILGEGRHFGEWWGQGIQRRYNLKQKVFSVFNTARWNGLAELNNTLQCVPVIATGDFTTELIIASRNDLATKGSYAAPGFMDPEGIVIYHTAGNLLFKYPFKDGAKGNQT